MPQSPPVQAPDAPSGRRARNSSISIAYLLADGGIPFFDSRKGGSIHARCLVRAFAQEGCAIKVHTLRAGRPKQREFDVHQIRQSRPTRWWLRGVLGSGRREGGGLWRWLIPWRETAPNWMTAVGILLWQRDFRRRVRKQMERRPAAMLYARHSWLATAYARLARDAGKPLALEVNAVLSIEKADRGEIAFAGLTRRLEREVFEAARVILPVTAELKRQIESFGINPAKVLVMPNAVDLDAFHPAAQDTGTAPHTGVFRIGLVHSFKPYHGMEILLDAVVRLNERIPGLCVRAIGGGPEFEATQRRVEELGIGDRVELAGTVAHDQVPALLRDCDVAVAPYHGPFNLYGCPMKLYEYMALKLPIVSARWGDIPNILEHGRTALLHEPADATDLADGLASVYEEPAAARERAENAYALVQHHSWRARARAILEAVGLGSPGDHAIR